MKKSILITISIFVLSLLYVQAAANIQVPSSLQLGEFNRNQTVSSAFTIKNIGDENLTNIRGTSSFGVGFSPVNFNLTIGDSRSINFNFTIAPDSDTGNISLGTFQVISDQFTTGNFKVYSIVRGGLGITDLDVILTDIRGDSETQTDLKDGEDIDFGEDDDVGPGAALRFDVRVENFFTDDDDLVIEDVSVLITILEIDDGDDVDDETSNFDIDAEESIDQTIELDIPFLVEQGSYDVEILVEGEDENGVKHSEEMTLELDIKKESTDVYVKEATLSRDTISCQRSTILRTKLVNIGRNDLDDLKIEAINDAIGLNFVKDDIVLVEDPFDEDSEYNRNININVADDVTKGTYPIKFNVYIKGDILYETKTLNLFVEDCSSGEPEEPEEEPEEPDEEEQNETVVVEQPPVEEEPEQEEIIPILQPPQEETTVTEEAEPISNLQIMMWSIIATIVIIIALVIVILLIMRPAAPKEKK